MNLFARDSRAYADWAVSNCCVMSWLTNNADERVNIAVMFLKTARIYGTLLKEMCSNEQTSLELLICVREVVCIAKDGRPLTHYYIELKEILDKLDIYQPWI